MMEIFLHQRATVTGFVKVDPEMKVGDFAKECLGEGALVWLEDGKEPLDPDRDVDRNWYSRALPPSRVQMQGYSRQSALRRRFDREIISTAD